MQHIKSKEEPQSTQPKNLPCEDIITVCIYSFSLFHMFKTTYHLCHQGHSHRLSLWLRKGVQTNLHCLAFTSDVCVSSCRESADGQYLLSSNSSWGCAKPKRHEHKHTCTHKPPHSFLFTVLHLVHWLPVFFFQRPCTAGYILWTHFESSFRNPVMSTL